MGVSLRIALNCYLFGVMGIFLLAAPWSPFWDQAMRPLLPSPLWPFVTSGWVRGAVSGLGAIDLFLAGRDASTLWQAVRRS